MALLPLTHAPVCDPQAYGHVWLLEQPQVHLLKWIIEAAQWDSSHFLLGDLSFFPTTTIHNSLEKSGKYITDSLMGLFQITGRKGRKRSSESWEQTFPYGPLIKVASGVKTWNKVFKPIFVCRIRQFSPHPNLILCSNWKLELGHRCKRKVGCQFDSIFGLLFCWAFHCILANQ